MSMIDVSVIIVNYNTKNMTADCVRSVITNTKDVSYEIIVVDNASKDNSVQYLKNLFPNLILIENDQNVGFGAANNIGVRRATGKYILLLNSDTLFLNNALLIFKEKYEILAGRRIIGTFLQDENGHYVNSFSDFENNTKMVARILYLYFPFLLKIRLLISPMNITPEEKDVDFITGADMFMDKKLFMELGGFDDTFFMYCEDEELCYRAKQKNIRCRVITGPQIVHLEGKSSNVPSAKRKMIVRSYIHMMKKRRSLHVS